MGVSVFDMGSVLSANLVMPKLWWENGQVFSSTRYIGIPNEWKIAYHCTIVYNVYCVCV